jgi:hypothetical protein
VAGDKFVPNDTLQVVLPDVTRNVDRVWNRYASIPGNRHIGEGEMWSIQFDSGIEVHAHHSTIYCSPNDVNTFKDSVGQLN